MKAPSLETSRLLLRPLVVSDAERLFAIYADPETVRYWNGPDTSLQASIGRIERMQAHWDELGYGDWALVDKKTEVLIGFCGVHRIQGLEEANLGFLIDRRFWGRGLATEASFAALRFGFEEAGLDQVVGTTAPGNAGAITVLERCGLSFWKEIARNGPRSVYRITRKQWAALERPPTGRA